MAIRDPVVQTVQVSELNLDYLFLYLGLTGPKISHVLVKNAVVRVDVFVAGGPQDTTIHEASPV